MMNISKRTRVMIVATIYVLHYLSNANADRLFLEDGGYARVLPLQEYPLSSFTTSAWVNVTNFSEGVTPILTYLSQDVSYQLSFFLRPEGVGILWGGPLPAGGNDKPLFSDRHPRFLNRQKRDAIVDYSGGLGDIENILTKRSSNSDSSWALRNFVDVNEMGVDDLMVSDSDYVHSIVDPREPRAHAYSQWTNVPYELHMEEAISAPHILPYPKSTGEPNIITKPSGNDDFVYFNWNTPKEKKSLGQENNWSPLWEPTKYSSTQELPRKKNKSENESEIKPALIPLSYTNSDKDKPEIKNEWEVTTPQTFKKGLRANKERFSPSTQPQNTPTTIKSTVSSEGQNVKLISRENNSFNQGRTNVEYNPPKVIVKSDLILQSKDNSNIKALNLPRNPEVSNFRYNKKDKIASLLNNKKDNLEKRKPRIPLWKLIKKPEYIGRETTEPNKRDIEPPAYFEPTLPPIGLPVDEMKPTKKPTRQNNEHRSRPVQSFSIRRKPHAPNLIKPKKSNELNRNKAKYTENINKLNKLPEAVKTTSILYERIDTAPHLFASQSSKYHLDRENEFEKTMQDPKMYKDGNTAVVYAVPIMNEREFYQMYKKYQKESEVPIKSKMSLNELYNKMRTGGVHSPTNNEVEDITSTGPKIYYSQNRRKSTKGPSKYEREQYVYGNEEKNLQNRLSTQSYSDTTTELRPTTPYTSTSKPSLSSTLETMNDYVLDLEVAPSQNVNRYVNRFDTIAEKINAKTPATDYNSYDYEVQNTYKNGFYPEFQTFNHPYSHLGNEFTPSFPPGINNYYEYANPGYQQVFSGPTQHYKMHLGQSESTTFPAPVYIPNKSLLGSQINLEPENTQKDELISPPTYTQHSNENIGENSHQSKLSEQDKSAELLNRNNPEHTIKTLKDQKLPEIASPESQFINQDSAKSPEPQYSTPGLETQEEVDGIQNANTPLDIHFEKLQYPFQTNIWYHLTFTWNARTNRASIYVNGELIGFIEDILTNQTHISKGGLFLLGKTLLPDLSDFDESSSFEGELSDVNVFATELPTKLVDAAFQCKYEPLFPQPVVWQNDQLKLYGRAGLLPSPNLCGLVT